MLKNTRFCAIKKYAFAFNYNFLNDLYAPIIGDVASNLYIKLIHEAEKQTLTVGTHTELNDFFKQVNLNTITFANARKKLEAIGLITSYLVIENENSIYSFILNEPLNFKDFISNQKFRHLLIRQIGQMNYEKLEYIYNSNRIPNNAENVSCTFESVFNDEDIEQITLMNFDELYRRVIAATSLPIKIDKQAKSTIETYFKDYDLSINEIEHIIYNCVIETDDHMYYVDNDLLILNLNKLVNSANNVNILQNIKLNRNTQMFVKYLDRGELHNVFNDYMALNSEQYLRAIVKASLTSEQKTIINNLRTQYALSDFVINLLIDYTLFKTNGILNEKYITKVARTINGLGLQTLNQVYDHFHFINSVDSKINNTPDTLVEWIKE